MTTKHYCKTVFAPGESNAEAAATSDEDSAEPSEDDDDSGGSESEDWTKTKPIFKYVPMICIIGLEIQTFLLQFPSMLNENEIER